jgi:hypothetical protein
MGRRLKIEAQQGNQNEGQQPEDEASADTGFSVALLFHFKTLRRRDNATP